MIWGPRPKLRIAPPMGREIPTIHILAYNFWTVSQKIKISVSMDSLCRAESEDVNYARTDWTPCRPFWNLSYIFISSEPFDISSQKSVGIINIMSRTYHRSMKTAPPTVREILRSLKKRLTFAIFVSNLYFWRHFVPWVMLILKMSHLSFSKTASVRRIEVNGQQSFRYSSLKICPILPKIVSDDLWIELNRTC